MHHLSKTLQAVCRETKSDEQIPSRHGVQLRKRVDTVVEIHPEAGRGNGRIGQVTMRTLFELMDEAEERESQIQPPICVYIHGDIRLVNIIFDPAEARDKLIDLHRSRYSDYTQNVSVFRVSNYRLQDFFLVGWANLEELVSQIEKLKTKPAEEYREPTEPNPPRRLSAERSGRYRFGVLRGEPYQPAVIA